MRREREKKEEGGEIERKGRRGRESKEERAERRGRKNRYYYFIQNNALKFRNSNRSKQKNKSVKNDRWINEMSSVRQVGICDLR